MNFWRGKNDFEKPSVSEEADPLVKLAALKKEMNDLEIDAELNSWPPKDRVRHAELKSEISALEESAEEEERAA
jgi:hypothetical protein